MIGSKTRYYTHRDALAAMERYCAAQERCQQEVLQKLSDGGWRGEEADQVLSELISGGFIDESRYAAAFVSGKFRINGWGRIKIRAALAQKQLSDRCIRDGFKVIEEEAYEQTLRKLLRDKARTLGKDTPPMRRAKLLRYAASRGYESALAGRLLQELS